MTGFDGVYLDGKTALSKAVRVDLHLTGKLILSGLDKQDALILQVIKVSPRLGRTRRILSLADGAQIHTDDNDAVDALFPQRNRLEAAVEVIERSWKAALIAIVVTLFSGLAFFRWGIPALAEEVAMRVPFSVEHSMGRQALLVFDKLGLVETSTLAMSRQQELRQLFNQLTKGLQHAGSYRLEFRLGSEIGANAFALPGGIIVMTDELVNLAKNDNELLAVLAHELGHQEYRHVMRRVLQSSAIVVIVAAVTGDVSAMSSVTIAVPTVLIESGYSRQLEAEADSFAFDLLKKYGLSPVLFANIMERLSKNMPEFDGVLQYTQSHPATSERIRTAQQAAESKE